MQDFVHQQYAMKNHDQPAMSSYKPPDLPMFFMFFRKKKQKHLVPPPQFQSVVGRLSHRPGGSCFLFWSNTLRNTGVIILPTQTMHYLREIPQNYHTFALFDSPQMGNLMIPWETLPKCRGKLDFCLQNLPALRQIYGSQETTTVISFHPHEWFLLH